jgi:hypothetical protein
MTTQDIDWQTPCLADEHGGMPIINNMCACFPKLRRSKPVPCPDEALGLEYVTHLCADKEKMIRLIQSVQ